MGWHLSCTPSTPAGEAHSLASSHRGCSSEYRRDGARETMLRRASEGGDDINGRKGAAMGSHLVVRAIGAHAHELIAPGASSPNRYRKILWGVKCLG
jgi:hypothetical protein